MHVPCTGAIGNFCIYESPKCNEHLLFEQFLQRIFEYQKKTLFTLSESHIDLSHACLSSERDNGGEVRFPNEKAISETLMETIYYYARLIQSAKFYTYKTSVNFLSDNFEISIEYRLTVRIEPLEYLYSTNGFILPNCINSYLVVF